MHLNNKKLLKSKPFTFLLAFTSVFTIYIFIIRPQLMKTMSTTTLEMTVSVALLLALAITIIVIAVTLLATMAAATTRKSDKVRPWIRRLGKQSMAAGILIAVIAVVTLASQWMAYTPPILGGNGKHLPGSIAELENVSINGSSQWITVRGNDTDNPVLLFLAGGPGGSQLSPSREELGEFERYFTVVNWEQPGSGKSYHAVPRDSLTPERYISDGHQLTRYLLERFNKDKIFVLGESWGSALGIWMVQQHPELYHAFIGTGQMVAFSDTEIYCYNLAIKLAKERGNMKKVEQLEKQGPPPYYGNITMKSANYLQYLSNIMTSNPEITNSGYHTIRDIAAPEYGLYDKLNYLRGIAFTFNKVYQQLYDYDLRKQATDLEVPVYFLIGRHDINTPVHITEQYYDMINAPHKELIWFEHSGHSPWLNQPDKFVDVIVTRVLKLH